MNAPLVDEKATLKLGALLTKILPFKGIVFLHGSLGAGKTTLVRGFLRALGHQGSTKSPTYTLVEPYIVPIKKQSTRKIYHFDLYRLSDPEELEYMGIRDYLDENALSFIEWPEKGSDFLPDADIEITLGYSGEQRNVQLKANNSQLLTAVNSLYRDLSANARANN